MPMRMSELVDEHLATRVRAERGDLDAARDELESSKANLSRLRMLRKEAAATTGVHGLFSGKDAADERSARFSEYERRVKRRELMYQAAPRAGYRLEVVL